MNKDALKKHRAALQNLLSEYGRNAGLSIEIGRITFTNNSFRFKAEFVETQPAYGPSLKEVPVSEVRPVFLPVTMIAGEVEKRLNKPFTFRGRAFTFVAYKPERPKYPVVGRSARGANYRFPIEVLGTMDIS